MSRARKKKTLVSPSRKVSHLPFATPNIVLFGMTGCGKSALINTIFECLEMDIRPAVTQTTGREGTKILESCDLLPNNVTVYDARGFYYFAKTEEGRNFSVLT